MGVLSAFEPRQAAYRCCPFANINFRTQVDTDDKVLSPSSSGHPPLPEVGEAARNTDSDARHQVQVGFLTMSLTTHRGRTRFQRLESYPRYLGDLTSLDLYELDLHRKHRDTGRENKLQIGTIRQGLQTITFCKGPFYITITIRTCIIVAPFGISWLENQLLSSHFLPHLR